jgi:PII-like signaling protein
MFVAKNLVRKLESLVPSGWDFRIEGAILKRRGASGYGKPRVFRVGQSVPVTIESVEVGRVAVADIVPSIEPASAGNGT